MSTLESLCPRRPSQGIITGAVLRDMLAQMACLALKREPAEELEGEDEAMGEGELWEESAQLLLDSHTLTKKTK